eukprot:m.278109 g.278109  ORF g.278109 m.278109 type:complete len:164 (+) comp15736_c1_seq5:1300-1791(+)
MRVYCAMASYSCVGAVMFCIGTKAVSDERYLRRHSPFELAERRRKRLDAKAHAQVLVTAQSGIGRTERSACSSRRESTDSHHGSEPSLPFTSFFPQVEDVQDEDGSFRSLSVVVGPKLPVVAFGEPIAKLPHRHFQLPSHGVNRCDVSQRARRSAPEAQGEEQ